MGPLVELDGQAVCLLIRKGWSLVSFAFIAKVVFRPATVTAILGAGSFEGIRAAAKRKIASAEGVHKREQMKK